MGINEFLKEINFLGNEGALIAIMLINLAISLILFLLIIITRVKLKRYRETYKKLVKWKSNTDIDTLLENIIEEIKTSLEKNKNIEKRINSIERTLGQCIQKIAMVRYNAFENMGSDLSFAVALLDNNDNGVVINGVYSRDSSSTYAKPIIEGKSRYNLSAEEIQAIELAKKQYVDKQYK
mgnify:CR=1 FL=1